jgi:hypothetical protein
VIISVLIRTISGKFILFSADFFSDILLPIFYFSLRESAQSAGDSFFFSRRTR